MKKRIIIILALLSLIACAKNEDKKKDPMAPKNTKTESQQIQDAKDAAQEKANKEKAAAEAAAKEKAANGDKPQPTPSKDGTKDSTSGTPAPTASPGGTPAPTTTSPAPTTMIPPSGAPAPEPQKDPTADAPKPEANGAPTDNQAQNPPAADGTTPPAAGTDATNPPAADTATPPASDSQAGKELEPPPIPTPTTPDITVASPTEATSYNSENLSLVIPHKENWGWIKINGADAEKLFNTLQIKTSQKAANDVWNPTTVKKAANVACYRQSKKETPKVPEFTCSLYLDYRKGTLNPIKDASKLNLRIPALNQNYNGEMLYMSAANKGKFSQVRLSGEDAKALYTNLESEATPYETGTAEKPVNRKKGENMECFEATVKGSTGEQKGYACRVYFNFSTGAALKIAQ